MNYNALMTFAGFTLGSFKVSPVSCRRTKVCLTVTWSLVSYNNIVLNMHGLETNFTCHWSLVIRSLLEMKKNNDCKYTVVGLSLYHVYMYS